MTDSLLIVALNENTAALELHGGFLMFSVGAFLGLLFVALVGFALLSR